MKKSPKHAKIPKEKGQKKAEKEKQDLASDWEIQEELDRIDRIQAKEKKESI